VLRVPFRVLAAALTVPEIAKIGKARAPDLARASYPIFQFYAEKYLAMNPDDPLSLAWAATGLVLADIGAECAEAVAGARRARPKPAPPGQPVTIPAS
jgi:hypothetical protein